MEFSLGSGDKPSFSVEFFPPKDSQGEERLWGSLSELQKLDLDFVSVTYGAGGSTRERTIRVTSEITVRTNIPTVAHLTCVGASRLELISILEQYQGAGIEQILALRGDPEGGPTAGWKRNPDGFDHADQLVELAREKNFVVGVAAFPDGHPASGGDFKKDIDVLLRKFELGASFATTQFFFNVDRYFRLVTELERRGSSAPVIAGILPITNINQLVRMAELSGTELPSQIVNRISRYSEDPIAVRKVGVEIAVELCAELLAQKVPGLHFYTMNSASSTVAVARALGLR
jgi:methylenetetrahydrofolate reductase (NADPH)